MKIVVAIAVAMTIMVAVNAGAGRDFACGEAVGFLCPIHVDVLQGRF